MKNALSFVRMLLSAAAALAALAVAAECVSAGCCNGDQFWILSTRHIEEVPCQALPKQVEVLRLEGDCWQQKSFNDFVYAHDPGAVTFFYVHGNRYTAEEAVERAWLNYRTLRRGAGPHVPLRFVIWSWPADPRPRVVYDVRVKAERTDLEGLYLGTVISRLPPDAMVSLQGFSFGTRVITGALHLVGGGQLEGRRLPPEWLTPRLPLRAGLLAPAFHNTWLLPGSFHSLALTQVDRMIVLYNSNDPVLRRYRLISPTTEPEAAGYTGLVGLEQLGPLANRVQQIDVRNEVGRTHDELRYLETSHYPMMRHFLLWRTWR